MKDYIYVLSYDFPGIYEIEVEKDFDTDSIGSLLDEYGLRLSNVEWLYSTTKLELETIEKLK